MSHIAPIIKTDNTSSTPKTIAIDTNAAGQITVKQLNAAGAKVDAAVAAPSQAKAAPKYQEPLAKRLLDAGTIQDNGFYTAAGVVLAGLGWLASKIGDGVSLIVNGPGPVDKSDRASTRLEDHNSISSLRGAMKANDEL